MLQEIKPEFTQIFELDKTEVSPEDNESSLEFLEDSKTKPTIKEKDFLNQLFIKNGLSVTALNNYLSCPWKFFFSNLIRIPGAQSKYMIFGSAVHEALSSYFDAIVANKEPNKNYLIKRFKEALATWPIQTNEYAEMLQKGEKDLSGYYDFYHKSWKTNILSEFNIKRIAIDKI